MRLFVLLCLMMTGLSACNTFSGFGQDVQNAGHAIKKAAD